MAHIPTETIHHHIQDKTNIISDGPISLNDSNDSYDPDGSNFIILAQIVTLKDKSQCLQLEIEQIDSEIYSLRQQIQPEIDSLEQQATKISTQLRQYQEQLTQLEFEYDEMKHADDKVDIESVKVDDLKSLTLKTLEQICIQKYGLKKFPFVVTFGTEYTTGSPLVLTDIEYKKEFINKLIQQSCQSSDNKNLFIINRNTAQ